MALTADQEAMRNALASLLIDGWSDSDLLAHAEGDSAACTATHRLLGEMGVVELVGHGSDPAAETGWADVCVLATELGAALHPMRLAPLAALTTLAASPENAAAASALTEMLDATGALWSAEGSADAVLVPTTQCTCDQPEASPIDGTRTWVLASAGNGTHLSRLAAADPEGDVRRVPLSETADPGRRLLAGRVAMTEEHRLPDTAAAEVATAVADVVYAAEQCGVARRALRQSLEHVTVREQFGRPIGAFQAVKHRCADMRVRLDVAQMLVARAAAALDSGRADGPRLAASARLQADTAAVRSSADNIQLHGGIGFTWEHTAHLAYKRALANSRTGPASAARTRLEIHLRNLAAAGSPTHI